MTSAGGSPLSCSVEAFMGEALGSFFLARIERNSQVRSLFKSGHIIRVSMIQKEGPVGSKRKNHNS